MSGNSTVRITHEVDAGNALPLLTPESVGFSFVRNRVLLHQHGRWAQGDPNATGTSLLAANFFHGASVEANTPRLHIEAMFTDGSNRHAYCRGEPVGHGDPLGLFDFNITAILQSQKLRAALAGGVTNAIAGGIIGGFFGGAGEAIKRDRDGNYTGNIGKGAIAGFVGGSIAGALSGGYAALEACRGATAGSSLIIGILGGGALGGGVEGYINEDPPLELLLDMVFGAVGSGSGRWAGAIAKRCESGLFADVAESLWVPIAWGYQGTFRKVYFPP